LQRQWPNGFIASISTFGLAGFSGARLGKVQALGATAGMPRMGGFVEKHFNHAAVDPRAAGWPTASWVEL